MSREKHPHNAHKLRSNRWFGDDTMRGFAHRQRLQQTGYRREDFLGRPVIAIVNTWSDISTCHVHLRERARSVREGVLRAGGYPIELPAMSLGEVMVKPTTMYYRNLLAMECEELLRSHPVDGAVLLGGCDKTTPGLLMGAISVDIPVIFVPAGATLSGHFKGEKIGTGTHTRKYWDALNSGEISRKDWIELESSMTRSCGTCNTMGTASTMAFIAETLGFTLPGAAAIPAVDSAHPRMAASAGERIVAMVQSNLTPKSFLTEKSFENAIIVDMALGGSTNAVIHTIAIAGRAGITVTLDRFDFWSEKIPLIADLMPSGKYLMQDLYHAGGSLALLSRLKQHLHLDQSGISGKTLGSLIADAEIYDDDVIRTLDNPVSERSAIAVLFGNIAPDGAVIKPSAASAHLMQHRGAALVFESHAEMSAKIDDPDLDVDENTVLVLKNAGPIGGPGMPEWGGLPIPRKLLQQGIRDMVRISDARMSGTHFGTCILHVAPESAIGGPFALIETGDEIILDVTARRLHLNISDTELEERRRKAKVAIKKPPRGYGVLFSEHVTQANAGCDFDFLMGQAVLPEPEIF